uniref:Mitogen-activated protein kinase kinase kinase 19 n=1 Tax=Leptobrachium leishanense TaxID=445787 RepID=A0A8C5R5L7_9ANUR
MKMTEGSLREFLEVAAIGDLNRLSFYASHGKTTHVNAQHPETGDTALILAAERNSPEVVGFLLEHGADVTLCNFNNQTALHVAQVEIQKQLLFALTRTSFPQLRLTQAAWQGDPEAVQHLLSAEPLLDVNVPNHQGLTPLMLAVRDGDLFRELNTDYRPLDVLGELVEHGADPRLCDSNGKSALCYALDLKCPLRQQLIDVLTAAASRPDVQDDAFCGFCPDTKSLSYTQTATRTEQGSPAAQTVRIGSQLNKDEISSVSVKDEENCSMDKNSGKFNKAGFGILNDLRRGARVLHDMERLYKKSDGQNTSLPRQWLTEPLPTTAAAWTSERKPYNTLQPPARMKTEEISEKMKSLGLGYLLQASRSEPNISQTARVNPLTDIADIKQNIWQRLTTPETARTIESSSLSMCHSPRRARLTPLSRSRSRKLSETNITKTVPSTNTITASAESEPGLSYHHKDLPKSSQLDNLEGLNISKDLMYISIEESLEVSDPMTHRKDNRTPRSGRCHRSSPEVEKYNHSQPSEDGVMDKIGLRGDSMEMTSENDQEIRHEEWTSEEERESSSHLPNKVFDRSQPQHELYRVVGERVLQEPLRTPMHAVVPFVQITFSELEPVTEVQAFSAKQCPTMRKGNIRSVPHNVNHSFNVIAQKEDKKEKTKKNKVRNKSAPDTLEKSQQRPLSNSKKTKLKSLPVPSLGFRACPSNSKSSKKAHQLEQMNTEKSSQRSHTQLAFYTPKVPKPSIARSKTAPDFTYINDTDMFVKLNPQNGGPGIFQMFETSFYTKDVLRDNSHLHREPVSSSKSLTSKSVRSLSANDCKSRTHKRANPRKKSSSGSAQKRKGSSAKDKTRAQKKEDNVVIISGTDWQIETTKHNANMHSDSQRSPLEDDQHQGFSDLSVIKEVTIEGTVSIHKLSGVNFNQMFIEISRNSDGEQHKNLKSTINGNLLEDKHGLRGMDLSNRSLLDPKGDGQNDETKIINVSKNYHSSVASNNESQADLIGQSCVECENSSGISQEHSGSSEEDPSRENLSGERENNGDSDCYFSADEIEDEAFCTNLEIEHKTEHLIAQLLEKITLIEEIECSALKTSTSGTMRTHNQDGDFEEQISGLEECSKIASLNANNSNNLNLEDLGDFSHDIDGKITWIKGEVLGKGAYGTVYCGLTSQGELIAAKQVILDASDPGSAEKEYKKLQEEVELLKTLKHNNIVGYLGTSLQDNMVTIFMEFVPGGSISSILKRFGPLHEIVISKYTKHILHGIAYLHKNRVIHRDIKGNNVMLMPNGVLKLIDFGCAKRLTRLSMSGTRNEILLSMHGTPYWMAPEVINESGHGEKSDIWSIGCTVFEMATGKPPLANMHKLAAMYYIGANRGLMPTLPDHFSKRARDFVDLCLIRDQEERPSAEQLLQHPLIKRRLEDLQEFQDISDL